MPGIHDLISGVEGGPYYTRSQVAKEVSRSRQTIIRWEKAGLITPREIPSDEATGQYVMLYTKEGLEEVREISKLIGTGKPYARIPSQNRKSKKVRVRKNVEPNSKATP